MNKLRVCCITTWQDFGPEGLTVFAHEQMLALKNKCAFKCLLPKMNFDFKSLLPVCRIVELKDYELYIGNLGLFLSSIVLLIRFLGFLCRKIFGLRLSLVDRVIFLTMRPLVDLLWRNAYPKTDKPELIHAHAGIYGGALAAIAGKKHDVPVLLTEHNTQLLTQDFSHYERLIETIALKNATKISVVGEKLYDSIRSSGIIEDKIKHIPNLVDTNFFSPCGLPVNPPVILTVSGLGANKNVPLLLKAFKIVVDSGIIARLVIGGEGPMRPSLQRMARELGLGGDLCFFSGALTREGVREWMRKCTVFALSSRVETFGCVVTEAQACGKPVVSTICGGPESIITDQTGILVPHSDNPEAFAKALIRVLTDKTLFSEKTIRQLTCDRFGNSAFAGKMFSVYQSTIAEYN